MYRNRPEAALASLLAALVILASPVLAVAAGQGDSSLAPSVDKMTAELVAAHGEAQRPRIARGLAQVASLWRPEDGDAASFEEFARRNFAADDLTRKALRDRMDRLHEQIDGSFNEMNAGVPLAGRRRGGADPALRRVVRRLRSRRAPE